MSLYRGRRGKYAILQTWIKQKRCRWVGLAGGILETGQLHFPHAVGVSLRTDGTLGSPKKTPVKRLPCRSIRHTSRRSAGVRHTLLYSHRARENKQPAACKMSGTVGSNFKKIIKGPCKVFLDIEQAGGIRSFSLPPVKRSYNTPRVLGLHETSCSGAGCVGQSGSSCPLQFNFSPSVGKIG